MAPSLARGALIDYLWDGGALPSRLADSVDEDFAAPILGAATWDRYTIANVSEREVTSVFDWLTPTVAENGRVMLCLEGHDIYFTDAGAVPWRTMIAAALAAGYCVMVIPQPIFAPNTSPEFPLINGVPTEVGDDDDMTPMDSDGGLPSTTRFIEPIIIVVNQALANRPTHTVVGVGHSGGGWAIEMAAAIDPRIIYSASIFGSGPGGYNDWAWYSPVGWSQYRLNPTYAHGGEYVQRNRMRAEGRRGINVVADGDDAYSTTGIHTQLASFSEQVNTQVAAFGAGEYEIVYTTATSHLDWIGSQTYVLADIDDYLARR